MAILPPYLYRGDSDPKTERKLKETFHTELLLTSMSNGGNGAEIFNTSISLLIDRHVGTVWNKSHFLSFSEDEQTAINYGSRFIQNYEVYDDNEHWDFAVLTFDTAKLLKDSVVEINKGIYLAKFQPANREFLPMYNVILIDVVAHLQSICINVHTPTPALLNAKKDKEWLILPAAPFGHHGEFTGKLDTACISERRAFRWL